MHACICLASIASYTYMWTACRHRETHMHAHTWMHTLACWQYRQHARHKRQCTCNIDMSSGSDAQRNTYMHIHGCIRRWTRRHAHVPIRAHAHAHKPTCPHMHMHVDLHAHTCTCTSTYMHTCTFTYTYRHMHMHIDSHAHMHIRIHLHTHARMHMHIHAHMHMHIHRGLYKQTL
jgi:hypothetical protein